MSALQDLLNTYRKTAQTEREKGTYFEELIRVYLRHEPTYRDLYSDVWTWSDWAKLQGIDARDTGIDLVAKTHGTEEFHAIQCKLYAEDHVLSKKDIDSFFTASGKKPFTHRLIVATTAHWSEHAEDALRDQQPPVNRIDLYDLENSLVDWSRYQPKAEVLLRPRKTLRPHQAHALQDVVAGLKTAERGKLIMACGTGKTFTSLKIAEAMAGKGGRVLFLVPSLALLSQTLTEWTQESETPLHNFAVCSDSEVGKKRRKNSEDDVVHTQLHELRYPATTEASRLAMEVAKRHDAGHMSVVYSTYHSIATIAEAQAAHGMPAFDLIVCDEAHRTTGATFDDQKESAFVKVHDAGYIHAAKRLYMTATPKIFADSAKAMAERDNVALCSMDDEDLYGKTLHVINFSEAVKQGLLVDYKVIVLSIEESHVNRRLQHWLKDEDNQIRVHDAAKIVGSWKALAKQGHDGEPIDDGVFMRRAVAFCQVIEAQVGARVHKVSSKRIADMFEHVVTAYRETGEEDAAAELICEAEHVDGGMSATEKEGKLQWLKQNPPENTCRILSNVRCLSEGVDVPALDAVLFLTPRNSQVDVVQSVGRVMRTAPGKERGYIVLPVVIPAGMEPHVALNDNDTYRVVWQVLQALRSHDDRFDAMVNKLELIGSDPRKMEVIAVVDRVQRKAAPKTPHEKELERAQRGGTIGKKIEEKKPEQIALELEIGEIERAIYARIVQKVGNRLHWDEWAGDIAKIARTHIDRIRAILGLPADVEGRQGGVQAVQPDPQDPAKTAFLAFAAELRDDLNDSLSDGEIIEMLAQHLITKPVFDALFEDYSFAKHNPMSKAMQGVLDVLEEHRLEREADTLQKFYDSVRERASGIDNAAGKQKIVVELYDKFFRNAFPKMTERLGIVYTPVEVVDFILRSVNHILKTEFGEGLGSKNVHILDPFTGTGTFITRLMQIGLISPEQLKHKYRHEIHANEIVLLAYYIAAINIEATYHDIVGGEYVPFEGICLTDTFQMYEKEDLVDALLVDNSTRRKRQKQLDIRVIVGNPPYSVGQKDDNDDAANLQYPRLDARLQSTYVARSSGNPRSLYDSYIRAIRWASDRIGDAGIIGFVTNAGFVDGKAADGLRLCLAEEFSDIYVFHLRGNQRTSGETSRREGGKIFGSGSRAPIAISLLVKNPQAAERGRIFLHDIGDYLSREDKLEKVSDYASVAGIPVNAWQAITADEHGDWLKQRDGGFAKFVPMGEKARASTSVVFETYSSGVKTNRDAWAYNASRNRVASNMGSMIDAFNAASTGTATFDVNDPRRIGWSWVLRGRQEKGFIGSFRPEGLVKAVYRPFSSSWLYYDRYFNENRYQMARLFPDRGGGNLAIVVKQGWEGEGFLSLMVDRVIDVQSSGGTQCFPLYIYDDAAQQSDDTLFADQSSEVPRRRDAITDAGLAHFQSAYPGETISKEDLFYYVYGILHSPDYRERYADNLSKELPRIPRVRSAADFWSFSKAGRALADLHLSYETVDKYPLTIEAKGPLTDADYRVEKMKFAKKKDPETGKNIDDRSVVIYNAKITMRGIPDDTWGYVVNGKAALDWVMERQAVRTDKASGIVNDANDWAIETMGNPKYPLELFQRVITVSLETQKIVAALPALDIREDG